MELFISKETIHRLLRDVKQIIKSPLTDNGIYYVHDDTDILKGYAMIIGPSETPYFGGYYFFEFKYPNDYPHSPPKVMYRTNADKIRFNPNLYTCGKVCISLLNTWRGEQWTSCQTISTILLTLSTLLCSDPLLNEPGVNKNHQDFEKYNKIIEYSNLNIAVCDIVNKRSGVYMDFFESFYPFVKESFLLNYDKLLKYATKQNIKFNDKPILSTNYYSMRLLIDYEYIINKLENCKLLLEESNNK
jgi:ubiquitin-conjugating enzyme E2 Z